MTTKKCTNLLDQMFMLQLGNVKLAVVSYLGCLIFGGVLLSIYSDSSSLWTLVIDLNRVVSSSRMNDCHLKFLVLFSNLLRSILGLLC